MSLYKYFGCDAEKLDNLLRCRILATPPIYLNDPWEMRVTRESATTEELFAMFKRYEPECGFSEIVCETAERASHELSPDQSTRWKGYRAAMQDPARLPKEARYFQNNLSKGIGIICLTAKPLDRLMWAHYGNGHRGFLAEFRYLDALTFRDTRARPGAFGPAIEVHYSNRARVLQRDFGNAVDLYRTKHEDWKYEEEWRVFQKLRDNCQSDNKGFYWRQFDAHDLVRVIVGLRVDDLVVSAIHAMKQMPQFAHVVVERVVIDDKTGSFVCEPIK